jgi:hypothetical protein
MFLGELCAGLIINKYHLYIFKSFDFEVTKGKYQLIYHEINKNIKDSYLKIYLILIILAFFDSIEFKISVLYLPKIHDFSGSLEDRL